MTNAITSTPLDPALGSADPALAQLASVPEEEPSIIIPWGLIRPASTPKYRTKRELDLIYNNPNESFQFGWHGVGKLWSALQYETVTGEFIRDVFSPSYRDNPDFTVTDSLLQKYASDLPEELQERIATVSDSFPEFLHQLDDARITMERREAMFRGGIINKATGIGAMIIGSGAEAVLATIGATAGATAAAALIPEPVTTATSPIIGIAAGAATATKRILRIQNSLAPLFKSRKAAAILKAGGITAAVDIPLELTRYHLDKSLTKTDAIIAVAGSAILGGSLAAWKPHMFDKVAKQMLDESIAEEAVAAAKATGKVPGDVADSLLPTHTVTVRPVDEILEEVLALKGAKLRTEGKRLKIKGVGGMKADNLRLAIAEKRRATGYQGDEGFVAAVGEQAEKDLENIFDMAILRKRARDVGAKIGPRTRAAAIKKAIVKTLQSQAETGTAVVRKKFSISNKMLGPKPKIKINDVSSTIEFATSLDRALWRVGSGSDFQGKSEVLKLLKDHGIEDAEALGVALRKAAKDRVKRAGEGGPQVKSVRVEAEGLLGKDIFPRRKSSFTMKIEEDILKRHKVKKRGGRKKAGKKKGTGRPPRDPEGDEPHDLASAGEEVVYLDGREIMRGPDTGVSLIDLPSETLGAATRTTPRTAGEKGIAKRERLALWVEGASNWTKKWKEEQPWFAGGAIAHLAHNILTPTATRLLAMEAKGGGGRFYQAVNVFFESPRGGGKTAQTILRVNHQRLTNELAQGMHQAQQAARAAGRELTDSQVSRALTSEIRDDLADPERIAVAALEKFHGKLLAHAKRNGLMDEVDIDARTYFHRIWKPTAFAQVLRGTSASTDDLVAYFTQALMSSARNKGLREPVARETAKRIVSYGTDPQAHRSVRATEASVSKIKLNLESKQSQLSLSDEDIEDIMDAVLGHVGTQPHVKGFAKRRIELDENFVGTLGGEQVHIDQFMHRNVKEVTSKYAHQVLGAVEMKKGMQGVFGENLLYRDAIKKLRDMVETDADKEYVDKAFTLAMRRISGQPLWESSEGTMRFVLGAQSFAQGTLGHFLGVAQLPEIANIMIRSGMPNAVMAFPGLRTLGKTFMMGLNKERGVRGADGRLLDKVAAELETFLGVGGEYFTDEHLLRRLDDMGFDEIGGSPLERFLEAGRQFSMLNPLGIVPMDTFLRRWGSKAYFQKFVNEAYKLKNGKPALIDTFWARHKFRFKELGLEDAELDRIFNALANPNVVSVRKGRFGNYRVLDVDFTKVKDQGAYDLLALAIRRGVDNQVQRQTIGEIPLWMSASPGAKLMMQYRVFAVAAKGKQLAAGIARSDAAEAVNLVGSIGLGYLGYTLLTYGRALGKSPEYRENYLAERLTFEEGIKSGIMRCSYASVLPMMLDTALTPFLGRGVFDPSGRTTHQGMGVLGGMVPVSLYKNLNSVLGESLSDIFTNKEMSKKDARDAMRLLWLTQIPGVNQLANYAVSESGMPESNRRR